MRPLLSSLFAPRLRPRSAVFAGVAACLGLAALPHTAFLAVQEPGLAPAGERFIGPGVRLIQWSLPEGPHALHAVEVDGANPFIRLGVSVGRGELLGLEPLSRQAERLTRPDRYPIAGVNGDFFYYPNQQQPGIPTNAAVLDGELLRSPFNRSSLVLAEDGTPSIRILALRSQVLLPDGQQRSLDSVNHPRGPEQLVLYTPRYGSSTRTSPMGTEVYLEPESFPLRHGVSHRARVLAVQRGAGDGALNSGTWVLSGSGAASGFLQALKAGDTVELRADFEPSLGPKDQVLGGGPRLVRDGRVSVEAEGGSVNGSFARTRHPRTAIGFNGRKIYLMVVDGRQPGYSVGMSLPELAQAMVGLGCTDAVNMDGGGSTTLWVRGALANSPSDGRERPVANGLLIFSTAPKGDAVRIAVGPREIAALAGAEVPLQASGEDEHYNPVPLEGEAARWSVDPALGAVRDGRFIAAAEITPDAGLEYRAGTVQVEAGAARGRIPVRIYAQPARVEVTPPVVRLGTRMRTQFRVRAFDAAGRPLVLPSSVRWEVSPEVGSVEADGTVATGEAAGAGAVRAVVNGVAGMAMVDVAAGAGGALEDFESGTGWTGRVSPAGLLGSVSFSEGPARSGSRSLKLEYDFGTGAGTRAVYATGNRVLGQPFALKLWVYGDGQGAWLRARLKDGSGATHMVDLARRVTWKGAWKELRAPLSDDLPGPVTLESIYVVEPDAALKPKGALFLDDLSVEQ